MDKKVVIERTRMYVHDVMSTDATGHDWWHVDRVTKTALTIAESEEGADSFVVELGALLHDIADHKFHNGDASKGPKVAREWLEQLEVDEEIIQKVCDIITQISFKGANVDTPMSSVEGSIVQDADRLDALGAVGVARCFAYGGHKSQPLYHPAIKPHMHSSFEEYKKAKTTSVNHFYEKLLLLKDRMNTNTGKELAQQRHAFMEKYLEQFFGESEGSL